MSISRSEHLEFAVDAAYRAGRLTLGYFRTGLRPEFKSDESPVTVADREAETLLRSLIEERYPEHAIIGEEHGTKEVDGTSHRWFLDPIDGTKSFVRGVPLYGVLVGLEVEGRVEVGVAYFPALDEIIYAARGEGCYWNGRRSYVSEKSQLSESTVSCTDIGSFQEYGRSGAWQRIQDETYYRVGWSDAYGHALVATGRLELMLDPVMSTWDCSPFPVILSEAGGYFGDWSGEETIYAGEGLSTTRQLLPDVLDVIHAESER